MGPGCGAESLEGLESCPSSPVVAMPTTSVPFLMLSTVLCHQLAISPGPASSPVAGEWSYGLHKILFQEEVSWEPQGEMQPTWSLGTSRTCEPESTHLPEPGKNSPPSPQVPTETASQASLVQRMLLEAAKSCAGSSRAS